GEIQQRAAMRDISVNGAAQIEAPSTTADAFATHQPRPHHPRQPRRKRVGLRDIGHVHDMTQVSARKVLEPGRALTLAASVSCLVSNVMTSFGMIGKARCSCRRSSILEMPTRCAPFKCRAGEHARLMNVTTKPIGVENLVETLPVRVRGA